MTRYSNQLNRIKNKIIEAKNTDIDCKVFGADQHQYVIHKPITIAAIEVFEKAYSLELPECYKSFILNIGNGGIGSQNSAAGPFLGIFPFGENVNELIYENTKNYLKNECVLFPKMTDEYWKTLTGNIDDIEEISDEEFDNRLGYIWGGILPMGSQGCTYLHGLVLNGKYKGRVVNLDMDRQKPQFTFEKNFLDWYERWLDEVISGELIKNNFCWFGYCKGGSEDELLTAYKTTTDLEEKKDCLNGLLDKNRLQIQSINNIEILIDSNPQFRNTLIQLICKSDYAKAKPYLIELAKTELLPVFQFIYWYAKDNSSEWLKFIETNIQRIKDEETFRFCTYLLTETKEDIGQLILPFLKNSNEKIRVTAYYTLGQLKNKNHYINEFIDGLNDNSNRVIHSTLQALSDVKDNRLLEHYRYLAEKFPVEQDYILVNLNHRLSEYGLTNKTIINKNTEEQKKWYEVWK